MNQLRQLMLEELRRCNFADTTVRTYLLARPPAQAEGVALPRQPLAHIQPSCDYEVPLVACQIAAERARLDPHP